MNTHHHDGWEGGGELRRGWFYYRSAFLAPVSYHLANTLPVQPVVAYPLVVGPTAPGK